MSKYYIIVFKDGVCKGRIRIPGNTDKEAIVYAKNLKIREIDIKPIIF